ncbi:MAG TPA: PIN domain-containing protein [Terriglobia bacterium]|jgi:predicted nucleic acid-binding protein|nr:PIN domain-containing protein [Terriglobia bacterium]
MEEVLLDTDVFSFLLRHGDTRAKLYQPHLQERIGVISYVTIGELYYWAERRKWEPRRITLLEEKIRAMIVVRYDLEVCRTSARLKCGLRTPSGSHQVIGDNDLRIAARAVRHGIPPVTHNRRHFEGIPALRIISEAP